MRIGPLDLQVGLSRGYRVCAFGDVQARPDYGCCWFHNLRSDIGVHGSEDSQAKVSGVQKECRQISWALLSGMRCAGREGASVSELCCIEVRDLWKGVEKWGDGRPILPGALLHVLWRTS